MSRRKTLTPKGEPRQGELVTLRTYIEGTDQTLNIEWPAGCLDDDKLAGTQSLYTWRALGVRRGDHFIVLLTDDIREGDYVEVQASQPVIGKLRRNEYSHYIIETIDGPLRLQVNVYPILGRVVGIWRESARAYVHREGVFRPPHETAKLYQFKRRA